MKKKNIIEIGVTSVLSIILLLALTDSLNKIAQKRVRPPAARQEKEQVPLKTPAQELLKKQEEESAKLELKRDPFTAAPIVPRQKSPSAPRLNGILWGKASPMAIVDNIVVKIGDRVGNKVVVDIKQDKVILSDGAERIELRPGG